MPASQLRFLYILSIFLLSAFQGLAQSATTQQGAILRRGTGVRISGAIVTNKRTNASILSNQLGFFSIVAAKGDSLTVSAVGYSALIFPVSDLKDLVVYLTPITQLNAVTVTGKSMEQELKETQDNFRSKGVYYKGKPPVLAALASPLTAINELFGKNAKRARRFAQYSENELEYQEISRRFSVSAIKTAVPEISDHDLPIYRSEYLPSVEQIRKWSDYDILVYIKTSYKSYIENKRAEAAEAEAHPAAKDSTVAK